MSTLEAITATGLTKSYRSTAEVVTALKNVSVSVPPGQIVALMGPSGSGKTTLLNILSGWESPDEGVIERGSAPEDTAVIEWTHLASVPQRLGLAEELTVRENVELPLILCGAPHDEVHQKVDAILAALDLTALDDRFPSEISLGEQQRASVARALVARPSLVLADEPTGNQDHLRTEKVVGAMRSLAQEGTSSIIATHDPVVASLCDRTIKMHDGELVSDETNESHRWRR